MTIRIRYNRAFEIEDIAPGDIIIDKQCNDIMYVIILTNAEAEELLCVRINEHGTVRGLMTRIGYECVDNYLKVEIDDAGY
jgi:hypothetical protein